MGYATQFWGTLKFTHCLSDRKLQSVEEVINAGRTGTPEIETIIEREREQRRQPGRAEIILRRWALPRRHRRLRSPVADAVRDVPLPKPFKGAILAPEPPGIWNVGKNTLAPLFHVGGIYGSAYRVGDRIRGRGQR